MSSHFESPRKILMLENGIAACGCLTNLGIVAFLTARPSRIAIEPGTSAGGDPIELPRIAAQDIALLSKEFALVLDKEGTVWSVPLADPTRVREVVRDMRALCARPAGDSALSVSEGGNVFVLSLGRGEVSARPVDVPGRTRALHASDGGTSIVADGDEGGQLRFYAGTTLDRGPSSRVVLPRQAADFDQLRGGRVFSAAFKRGGTSLCVVMRDGARTETKILALASAVADVAVTDASIVAAMVDGSLALYDMASIVTAGEGFVTPVHAVALGSTGRPRVALAITIKGTTSIWVGTAAGEAMRASLVEGAVPVKTSKEEVVVTPQVSSEMEALRKELEETRHAREVNTTDLQSRTNERDQLQAALDAQALNLQSRTDELHTRTNERDQLQATLDAQALDLQSRIEEREQFKSEAAAAEARAIALETRISELDAQLSKNREAQDAIRDELERVKTDLVRQRIEFESSRAKRIEDALPERVVDGLEILASLLGRRH